MKYLCVALGMLASPAVAQTVLSGTVRDARTQAPVPFATVAVPGQAGGTVSNAEGTFRLALPAAGADSVRVQSLGYAPLAVAVRGLPAGPLVLRLAPQAYTLQEATVRGYSPASLLWQAVRRTTAALASPVVLQTYYREFTTYNGEVAKFGDGLVDYYLQANPRRPHHPEVQTRIRESRVGQAALSPDDARMAMPIPVGVAEAGRYYDPTYELPALDSTHAGFYRYALLEFPAGAAADYYAVRCTPTTQKADYLQEALVYIDRGTLTIRHIETSVPASLTSYYFSFKLFGISLHATQFRQRVDYHELAGRLYPSFVRQEFAFDITKGGQLYRYLFSSDLLVRDLAAAPAPFPRSEQYSGPIYKRGTHYTSPYWQAGNVVPATAAEEAAIQRLAE